MNPKLAPILKPSLAGRLRTQAMKECFWTLEGEVLQLREVVDGHLQQG
jgi:hypothetical protein